LKAYINGQARNSSVDDDIRTLLTNVANQKLLNYLLSKDYKIDPFISITKFMDINSIDSFYAHFLLNLSPSDKSSMSDLVAETKTATTDGEANVSDNDKSN
jgi:hypothetical protein